jgi:predicted RNA-binding protein
MYLRNVFKGKNSFLYKSSMKRFSVLDVFNRDSVSYRMTKYDPTKEIEVNIKLKKIIYKKIKKFTSLSLL